MDDESVVGEECHIISPRPDGPRHDPSYPPDHLDSYKNLILLCRVHHKMVDDQSDTYTADILRQKKADHQSWASAKLKDTTDPKPLRVRRTKQGAPTFVRLTTGKEVLDLVIGACAGSMDHDELMSQQEVDLVGGFLDAAKDWGEMYDQLEPSHKVQAAFNLTCSLKELEEAGFFVFGGREVRVIEGGYEGPSNWPIVTLRVLRKSNDAIIQMGSDDQAEGEAQQERTS